MDDSTRQFFFSGQVQGVGFRWTVSRLAAELTVTGFVRNLADGRVEAVVSGHQAAIESLLDAIRQHFRGNIESVEQMAIEPVREFSSFEIRH
ncbi:MAG: acylphosphatase [Planctomycetaceae bacterium]